MSRSLAGLDLPESVRHKTVYTGYLRRELALHSEVPHELEELNDPFILDQSERFAARLAKDAGADAPSQIRLAFRLAVRRAGQGGVGGEELRPEGRDDGGVEVSA